MLTYPNIDPVALSLGPLTIHWYGLMYLLAFTGALLLGRWRAQRINNDWTSEQVSDLIFYGAMGVILGGRCGYVLFYNFPQFLEDPLWLLRIWEGGMSFHGGLLGVLIAMWMAGRKYQRDFFQVTDFIAPLVPLGLMFGRIGNFIGNELWGRVADPATVPWAMVFPGAGDEPRHPSQLYQASLEGLLLFILLWLYSAKPRPTMAVSGAFLMGYGCMRFIAEFFRQPDAHIGFDLFGWLSRGQLLSLPMVVLGIFILFIAYRQQKQGATQS